MNYDYARRPSVQAILLTVVLAAFVIQCGRASIDIKIPEAEVRRNLEKKFPISKPYAEVAQVTLRDPVLLLGRNENRLTAGFNAALSPRGLGAFEISTGRVVFSSGLAFDNASGRFLLSDIAVDSIQIDLGPLEKQVQRGIEEVISAVLRERLEGMTVYQLKQDQLRTPIARLFLRKIAIRKDGIVVTMGF